MLGRKEREGRRRNDELGRKEKVKEKKVRIGKKEGREKVSVVEKGKGGG